MFEVVDAFQVSDYLSVTLKGKCDLLNNGVTLVDTKRKRRYRVLSVAMVNNSDNSIVNAETTVLM